MASIIEIERQWAVPAALMRVDRGSVAEYAEACVSAAHRTERRLAPVAIALQGTGVSTALLPVAFPAAAVSAPAPVRELNKSITSFVPSSFVELEPRDRRSGAGTGVKGGVPPRGRPDKQG